MSDTLPRSSIGPEAGSPARTSAEVLEARAAAQAALHYAKLQKAANETQADCLAMIKRAEIRMADEIDAAQARGDVARPTDSLRQNTVARNSGNGAVTYDELGVTGQRVAEWRELRDAGEGMVDQPSRRPSTRTARQPTPTSSGPSERSITGRSSPARPSGTPRPSTSRRRAAASTSATSTASSRWAATPCCSNGRASCESCPPASGSSTSGSRAPAPARS